MPDLLTDNISVSCGSQDSDSKRPDPGRPWDRAMLAFLRAMRHQGKPIRWIAARLGITPGRTASRAAKLRLIVSRPREALVPHPDEPPPLGPVRDIAGAGLCRWIAADTDAGAPWRMCAHPCAPGSAWCAHHKSRAYLPETAP